MKLSIITINWNNREGLEKTLKSVAEQTCRDFEYIVVDGASTDGSAELLNNPGFGITHGISEKDSGIYNAMNKGTRLANGDYCLFLNSGDTLYDKDVIRDILPHLTEDKDIIIGNIVFSNTGLKSIVQEPLTMLRLYEGSVPHPASFIRRSLLIKHPYDESLRIVSDWKFFLQTLVLDSVPYSIIDRTVSLFECNGLSTDRCLVETERQTVLKEMFPSRVLLDYLQFTKGSRYTDSDYDRFYLKLRNYQYGSVLYSLNVVIMRIASLFMKSARFSRSLPLKIEKNS